VNDLTLAALFSIGLTLFLLGIIVFTSYPYHRRAKLCLRQLVRVDPKYKEQFEKQFGVTEATATAVPLFDVLYHTSKLDPHCVEGVSHLHHAQHFQNLGSVVHFLHQEIIPASTDSNAWRGMIHKYQGYTGEQVEIDHLHETADPNLIVPESGTQEGYDVMVHDASGNLVPFDIKTVDTPANISEHLQSYPDIDVIANSEMATAFSDNPQVHIDPMLSSQDAFHATDATFYGIDSLGNWLHHIPIITLVVASIHNGIGVVQGRKSISDAASQTAMTVGGVGFGALGGSNLGLAAGLLLAPATGGLSAIVIPAVTTVLGSILGVLSGKKIANWFKSRDLRADQAHLKESAVALRSAFLTNCDRILRMICEAYRIQYRRFRTASKTQGWLERLLEPTVMTKFYSMARKRTKVESRNTQNFYVGLRNECNKHEDEAAAGLIVYAQGRDVFSSSEAVRNAWDGVRHWIQAVEREKARLA
jgi:hypothetical protein